MVEPPRRGGRPSVLESLDYLVVLPGIHRAWRNGHRDCHRSSPFFLYCSLGQAYLTHLDNTMKRLPRIIIPPGIATQRFFFGKEHTPFSFVCWFETLGGGLGESNSGQSLH